MKPELGKIFSYVLIMEFSLAVRFEQRHRLLLRRVCCRSVAPGVKRVVVFESFAEANLFGPQGIYVVNRSGRS